MLMMLGCLGGEKIENSKQLKSKLRAIFEMTTITGQHNPTENNLENVQLAFNGAILCRYNFIWQHHYFIVHTQYQFNDENLNAVNWWLGDGNLRESAATIANTRKMKN